MLKKCCGKDEDENDEHHRCEPICDKGRPQKSNKKKSASGQTTPRKGSNLETKSTGTSEQMIPGIESMMPYVFRLPMRSRATTDGIQNAKCPPFYLQLDHTLAVLWCLFSSEKRSKKQQLGINQLQWALYFLRGIRINNDYPPDVAIAIQTIEDQLIDAYANMSDLVMQPKRKTDECLSCDLARNVATDESSPSFKPRRPVQQLTINMFKPLSSSTPYKEEKVASLRQKKAIIMDDIRQLKMKAASLLDQKGKQDPLIDLMQTWNTIKSDNRKTTKS